MKLQLNGKEIELDIADGLSVQVSEDGTKVKISGPEPEVIEKIRIVEVAGPETIRYIPQITYPDPQPYIPNVPYYPTYPSPTSPGTPWPGTYPTGPTGPTGPHWIWTGGTLTGGLTDSGLSGGGSISDNISVGDVVKMSTTGTLQTNPFTINGSQTSQYFGLSDTADIA